MSGSGTVRAAVIGAGFIGPQHIDAIRRTGHAQVVALVDITPERSRASAAALGIESDLVTPEQVFADPSIDVVHVCTPNSTHVALATAALEAGKHVVVEKPVSDTAAEARSWPGWPASVAGTTWSRSPTAATPWSSAPAR